VTHATALVIGSTDNDIRCELYGQDAGTGRFAGAVNLYRSGVFHITLLSSRPGFASPEEAVAYMEEVVQQVRAAVAA